MLFKASISCTAIEVASDFNSICFAELLKPSIDAHAFMIVSKVNEVRGKGFTFKKEYIE